MMEQENASTYYHRQTGPWSYLLLLIAIMLLAQVLVFRQVPAVSFVCLPLSVLFALLAGAFHHLTVADEVDRLSIRFGPIPFFRRSVRYDEIVGVTVGRTRLLDGWGVHWVPGRGWTWSIWGYDCVVLELRKSVLRLGTNDAKALAAFLAARATEATAMRAY